MYKSIRTLGGLHMENMKRGAWRIQKAGWDLSLPASALPSVWEYLAISLHGIRLGWYDFSDSLYFICNIRLLLPGDRRDSTRTRRQGGPIKASVSVQKCEPAIRENRWIDRTASGSHGSPCTCNRIHSCCPDGFSVPLRRGMRTDCRHETRYESNWACSTVLLLRLVIAFGL